jgi:Polyketide cyclase / dehydrase and lipid transport
MPRIHFQLRTELEPAAVLAALTDFGPARADVWPNIDTAHLQVHESGPGWAEVTEGSSVAGGVWERSRYEWTDGGRVSAVTVDSNTWAPGSRWDYRLTPAGAGGTDVEVQVLRIARGAKGLLLGAFVALFGTRRLRGDMAKALARVAARGAG